MRSTPQQARHAGVLYFLLALSAPLGLVYVPGKLFIEGDAAATAERIRTSEGLLRAGIASELVHQVLAVFLVLALYRLFVDVDRHLARLLVALGALLSVPIAFVNVAHELAAQMLASRAGFLSAFAPAQLDALAYLFLRLHGQGIVLASVFWGLWLFPFGLLVIRSRFLPPLLGYLLWVAGAGYVVGALAALVLPRFEPVISPVTGLLVMAELPILFWLLLRGAQPSALAPPAG